MAGKRKSAVMTIIAAMTVCPETGASAASAMRATTTGAGEGEVDDKQQVPGGTRPLQRRPNHGAKRSHQVEQNVAQNADGVDGAENGK